MPKGIYPRSADYLALLASRMAERRRNGSLVAPIAHLRTPEMRLKADAANRLARPPKRYARAGTGENCRWIHRMRAEKALGRPLPEGAEVHHADGSKDPNAPLVICNDNAYHMGLHRRMRVKAAGGDPWSDKICAACKLVKAKSDFWNDKTSPEGLATKCKVCVYAAHVARRARKRLERSA